MAKDTAQLTHYEVLSLPKDFLESQKDPTILIRRAYHRALLRHHPDKAAAAQQQPRPGDAFTVDQIADAFAVLSYNKARAEYDKALVLQLGRSSFGRGSGEPNFQTGVESVDLDDLALDPSPGGGWYRSCRCGNERGYVFGEADLEEAADDGELMVGCQDCSLWLRVQFAVLDDDDDGPPLAGG